MRSHLTRHVFRRLLSNDGYIFNCPRKSAFSQGHRYGASLSLSRPTRRSFFGFSQKGSKAKKIKPIDLDPGLGQMFYLLQMRVMKTRPPPANELVKAFNAFIAYKRHIKERINDLQAQHVLHTFRYLRDLNSDEQGCRLSDRDLEIARDAMLQPVSSGVDSGVYLVFMKEVYAELQSRRDPSIRDEEIAANDFKMLITGLCRFGGTSEAKTLMEEYTSSKDKKGRKSGMKLWNLVLEGFSRENNEDELLKVAQMALDAGIPYRPTFQRTMVTFFARKNDMEATKFWFNKQFASSENDASFMKPDAKTMKEVLQFSLRNNEIDWCNRIFYNMLETNPDKSTWDIVFQWAAGSLGKGVEDVEHMMEVMLRHNAKNPQVKADAATINGLVELAISKDDYYLAERYLALASKMGIRPNAKTLILQMGYRIDALDFTGAQAAYEKLQGQEIEDNEDLLVINKYLRALCTTRSPKYDTIISLVEDLEDREARLEGDTISALCLYHLYRGELQDASNVIKTHSFHNSLEERARTRVAVLEFCFDRTIGPWQVWEWYGILREMFDEISIEDRTRLMDEFFERGRGDMATHVFGHMRQQQYEAGRPRLETYVQCLKGIAQCKDMESLKIVHNMLTMDTYIEPNTKLYNALMLAYKECGDPQRASKFWASISDSTEGPTYSSLQIIFGVCYEDSTGLDLAKSIWEQMRQMEVDVTSQVFRAYIHVLARHNHLDDAKSLVENMESITGHRPDMNTVGMVFNATSNPIEQYEVQRWIQHQYPQIWKDLQEVRFEDDATGVILFDVQGDADPEP